MKKELDIDLFEKSLLKTQQQGRVKTFLSDRTILFLDKYNIPEDIKELLETFCYNTPISFGNIYFNEVNDIEEYNLEESISCIENDLLVIGSGLNGDPVVIDIRDYSIGFVFHDELWEKQELNARDAFISMKISFGCFYQNAVNDEENFPRDAYEAEKKLSSE